MNRIRSKTVKDNEDVTVRRDVYAGFRINRHIKAAVKKMAKQDGVSFTEFMDRLIIAELKKRKVTIEVTKRII